MSTAKKDKGKDKEKSDRAVWNDEETDTLLDYLIAHQGEAGDGHNFKLATFEKAAAAIAPFYKSGAKKNGKHCKTKWTSVRLTIVICLVSEKSPNAAQGNIQRYHQLSVRLWALLGR